jgi:uncharacterized protein with NAD-binding domain and iron-sulfur cluster
MDKTRIVILGGGPAALATAFELTNTPELRARYEIDLYQIGWLLGGKCASVRNRAARFRNEEHGLHVLGGFYHNVFSQLRPLYEEWAQVAPDTAIPFADAFIPHDTFTLLQRQPNDWRAASVALPPNDLLPGVNPPSVTPVEMLGRIVSWLGDALERLARGEPADMWMRAVEDWNAPAKAPHLITLVERGEALMARLRGPAHGPLGGLAGELTTHIANVQAAIQALAETAPPEGPDWLGVVELIATIARGFVADRLDVRGFDSINDLDAAAWLTKHGGSARAVSCPLFEAGYHYSFAFEDGDWTRPNIAAGVGMRGLLRMVFAYHGAVFMHMNGGMGEVIATPYFEVLSARGVHFHFFNRVEALIPGDDGRVEEIRLRVQTHPAGGATAYQPVFDYDPGGGARHRRCWPEAPLYEQLTDADAARAAGDLGKWIDSAGFGEEASIHVDRDFDLCIVGMSMGTLRETTTALGRASPAWQVMLDTAGVTPTIAGQIWRRESASSFHGVSADGLMTGYEAPDDTWGDMSFLTVFEQPDATGAKPASLSYLCGPITPGSGPERATRPARETELWLQRYAAYIFPGLDDGQGGYRLDGEIERYSRINDDPIDLYVRSPSGSIDKRLRPDGSGFSNLMLVGDWTRNNFDCGAVETAVLSAKLCARAISGSPTYIYGESDFA